MEREGTEHHLGEKGKERERDSSKEQERAVIFRESNGAIQGDETAFTWKNLGERVI